MTLLLSWVGKDSRKISSCYIASDSRISWGGLQSFDYAQKVFAFTKTPDILGYCGDVLYPTIVLNQILSMGEQEILFNSDFDRFKRSEIIFSELKTKFKEYPIEKVACGQFQIIHISRDNEIDFLCNIFTWSLNDGWRKEIQKLPCESTKIVALGSGKAEFFERYLEYYKRLNCKTSRALFQCLSDTLLEIKDLQCGGAPQLVGLYNKFNGRKFGVIYNNKRYFLGKEISDSEILNNIEWRNELFERCDGAKMKILKGAQRQPNDLKL